MADEGMGAHLPQNFSLRAKDNPILKDADVKNGLEDTGSGKGKLGRSERVALTYIHYQM